MPLDVRNDSRANSAEAAWEQKVSAYIGAMSVVWVNVPDGAGVNSMRGFIEKNAIALLSNQLDPIEPASRNWLGHYSPRDEIRRSCLWNLNYVDQPYDRAFLDELDKAARRT
jgi:hypothetical protein